MLFMIVERFKNGDVLSVRERFKSHGRMLPEGVVYRESWVDPEGLRCFQVMEASHPELLNAWIERWNDLVDFELIPVVSSDEFWSELA